MEQVNIWKCDFCKKTSFHKGTIQKHSRKCFHNPGTFSCATCLWFSPLVAEFGHEVRCYLGELAEPEDDTRLKLKTNCPRWMYVSIYWYNETCENQDEMMEKLLSGQEEYFKALQIKEDREGKPNPFSNEVFTKSGQD